MIVLTKALRIFNYANRGKKVKEIKRYKITFANGNSSNVTKCDDGHWVHYSDFKQLQAKIKEFESDKHINEIKVQGIEEFIKLETERLSQSESNSMFKAYGMLRRRLSGYLAKLRANHE